MPDPITTEAMDALHEQVIERLTYHALGAWWMGYDYLHLYEKPTATFETGLSMPLVKPSNARAEEYPRYRYIKSYDLTSVSREEIASRPVLK